jgi:outer membrane immunogenic protein
MKMRSTIKVLLLVSAAAVGAQSASAADLPARPVYKAPAQIVSWDWTGPYLGVYAGIAASRSRSVDPTGAAAGIIEHTGYGFTGGGTIGYNWQTSWNIMGGAVVVGLEGDIGYFDAGRRAQDWATATVGYEHDTSWLGTARGRAGVAVGPNLTYFTGGYAALDLDDKNINTATGATVSSSKVRSGYALGSGLETMLGGGWTAKSEYMFTDFGDGDTLVNGGTTLQSDKLRYHSQRFGVNYLFGAGNRGPLPQTNWNGFYIAGVYGIGVSSTRGTGLDGGVGGELGNNGSGFMGGGQVGWNWTIAPRWVVGLEGDVSYLGIDHTSNNFGSTATSNFRIDTTWFATARGRFAYNTGPALLYVTGGGAWMGVEQSLTSVAGTASSDKTLSGWTGGGGIEIALGSNWSSKNEYLFVDLGDGDALTSPGTALTLTPDYQFHMFRSALVYRFN